MGDSCDVEQTGRQRYDRKVCWAKKRLGSKIKIYKLIKSNKQKRRNREYQTSAQK